MEGVSQLWPYVRSGLVRACPYAVSWFTVFCGFVPEGSRVGPCCEPEGIVQGLPGICRRKACSVQGLVVVGLV